MEQRIRFQQLYKRYSYGHKVHSIALFVTRASVTSVSRCSRVSRDRGHGELGCHVTVYAGLSSLRAPRCHGNRRHEAALARTGHWPHWPQLRPRNLALNIYFIGQSGADRVELTQPRSTASHCITLAWATEISGAQETGHPPTLYKHCIHITSIQHHKQNDARGHQNIYDTKI